MTTPLIVRPLDEEIVGEANHVRDSWTRSFAIAEDAEHSGEHVRIGNDGRVTKWLWVRAHRLWVKEQWPTLTVLVAVHPRMPDEAIGWVALTPAGDKPLVVHYVFVKPNLRKHGTGAMLLRAAVAQHDGRRVRYSHRTPVGNYMIDRLHPRGASNAAEAAMR